MRFSSLLSRKTFVPIVAGVSLHLYQKSRNYFSSCEVETEDDEWLAEKQKCPLCKLFLESACREQVLEIYDQIHRFV